MRPLFLGLLLGPLSVCGSVVYAGVTAVPGGYEVSYNIELHRGTSNGQDIRDVFIFEWDASQQYHSDHAYAIASKGHTRLVHVITFRPTAALVIGYAEGVPGVGDGNDHLFTLTNGSFADEATGVNWGAVFPGIPPEPRIGHNAMIALLKDAAAGDAAALATILGFIDTEGHRAAFDPAGEFRVLEWTIGGGIDGESIPTLSTYGLVLMAAAILLLAVRRLGAGAA